MKTTTRRVSRPWRWGLPKDGKLCIELVPVKNSANLTGKGLPQGGGPILNATYQNDATNMQDPLRRVRVLSVGEKLLVEDRESTPHEMTIAEFEKYRLVWMPEAK